MIFPDRDEMIRYSYRGHEILVKEPIPWEEWMKMRERLDDVENVMLAMMTGGYDDLP